MTAQFKVGSYYRQRNGDVVQVVAEEKYKGINGHFYPGSRMLSLVEGGSRNVNGECCSIAGTPMSDLDLLPGELHNVNGQWVPVAEEAPKQVTWAECMAEVVAHVAKQAEPQRPALDWNAPKPFDAFKGFFAEPADIADWQDTYFPR